MVIATPTDYNDEVKKFDTQSVDEVVTDILDFNKKAFVVIKSTLPIGHTKILQDRHSTQRIFFSRILKRGSIFKG